MHVRINYVDIKPENFGEVDPFWQETVQGYDGMVRAYFLRDGDSAHTLSVVLFDSEAAMTTNTEQSLGDVVRRAAEHRLSEPEIHQLEVCAQVPGNDGDINYSRVIDVTLKTDRMSEVIDGWPEAVSAYGEEPGFRGGYMCGDRATGKVKSVSFWESKQSLEAHEQSGALKAAVEPYKEMLAVEPKPSYWNVRVVVP